MYTISMKDMKTRFKLFSPVFLCIFVKPHLYSVLLRCRVCNVCVSVIYIHIYISVTYLCVHGVCTCLFIYPAIKDDSLNSEIRIWVHLPQNDVQYYLPMWNWTFRDEISLHALSSARIFILIQLAYRKTKQIFSRWFAAHIGWNIDALFRSFVYFLAIRLFGWIQEYNCRSIFLC